MLPVIAFNYVQQKVNYRKTVVLPRPSEKTVPQKTAPEDGPALPSHLRRSTPYEVLSHRKHGSRYNCP